VFIHYLAFLSLAKIDGENVDLYDQASIHLTSVPRRVCSITVSAIMIRMRGALSARARQRDKSISVCAKSAGVKPQVPQKNKKHDKASDLTVVKPNAKESE